MPAEIMIVWYEPDIDDLGRTSTRSTMGENIVSSQPLDSPWEEVVTEDGRVYYWNQVTDKVSWECPWSQVAAVDAGSPSTNSCPPSISRSEKGQCEDSDTASGTVSGTIIGKPSNPAGPNSFLPCRITILWNRHIARALLRREHCG